MKANLPKNGDNTPNDPAELRELPAVKAVFSGMSLRKAGEAHNVSHATLATWVQQVRDTYGDEGLSRSFILRSAALTKKSSRGSTQVNTYPVYGAVKAGAFDSTLPTHDGEPTGSYYTTRFLKGGEEGEPFALTVEGLSMTDGSAAVEFPEGSKVLVNPNAEPHPGDYVVAMDIRDGSTTLKRFMRLDSSLWLKPLNREYKPIEVTEYHRIIGVVEEAMLPLYERA